MEPSVRPQTIELITYPIYRVNASDAIELHRPAPAAPGIWFCGECGLQDGPYGCKTWRTVHWNPTSAADQERSLRVRARGILHTVQPGADPDELEDQADKQDGPVFVSKFGPVGRVRYADVFEESDDEDDDEGLVDPAAAPDEQPGMSRCAHCRYGLDTCNRSGCGQRQAPGWRWPLPCADATDAPGDEQEDVRRLGAHLGAQTATDAPGFDSDQLGDEDDTDPRGEEGPPRADEEAWDAREDAARGANL